MANIAVRNDKQIAPVLELPEPVQMLRELLRWNPFRETAPHAIGGAPFVPAFDVRETKDRFVFFADLPGVKENEIEISLAGTRLVIAGNRRMEKVEENETYFTTERAYGAFQRSFTLPDGIDPDHIVAELRDGVLSMVVPKTAEAKARKILLKTGPKS